MKNPKNRESCLQNKTEVMKHTSFLPYLLLLTTLTSLSWLLVEFNSSKWSACILLVNYRRINEYQSHKYASLNATSYLLVEFNSVNKKNCCTKNDLFWRFITRNWKEKMSLWINTFLYQSDKLIYSAVNDLFWRTCLFTVNDLFHCSLNVWTTNWFIPLFLTRRILQQHVSLLATSLHQ
jgi:hypothetical protein